jgi:hypothetical protein
MIKLVDLSQVHSFHKRESLVKTSLLTISGLLLFTLKSFSLLCLLYWGTAFYIDVSQRRILNPIEFLYSLPVIGIDLPLSSSLDIHVFRFCFTLSILGLVLFGFFKGLSSIYNFHLSKLNWFPVVSALVLVILVMAFLCFSLIIHKDYDVVSLWLCILFGVVTILLALLDVFLTWIYGKYS